MHIGWPQLILIGLNLLGTGMALAKDGEPKGKYSFWSAVFADLITFGLLYWGGFFS